MSIAPAPPIVEATRDDLIWTAGMFEGEGTVTIAVRRSDETYRLLATVGNTDEQLIDFLHDRWAGWKQTAYGDRPGRQPAWTWTVAGPRALAFLHDIEEHIRTERVRRKIALAVEFRASQGAPGFKPEGAKRRQRALYERMKLLNLRGSAANERRAAEG